MKFQSLKIVDWKQFGNVEIGFHPNITILTGANGSGKTTILNLLAQHFGWDFPELATPAKDKRSGVVRWFARFFKQPFQSNDLTIGNLVYDNGSVASLTVPDSDSPHYMIQINPRQAVSGLNLPSHRPVFSYTPVSQISISKRTKREAADLVSNSHKERVLRNAGGQPSCYHIKETLLTWAAFGFGNEAIESDQEQVEHYLGFQEILREILPQSLAFKKFEVRKNSEIVLITDSGDFMLDAVSGGVSALIVLAWQIYMFDTGETDGFTVLIDEVENHLHASMQRAVLPDFIRAFPHVQFVVSTHSPLIVGSVKESNVYALRYNESKRVDSLRLDLINKAKTAGEILRDVLGVPFTMPIWVEERLASITDKYAEAGVSETTLDNMRNELAEIGLEELMPKAIIEVLEKNDQAQ